MLAIQISLLIVFAGSLGGLLVYTDVYSDIKSVIVDTTCLSCIKMDPVSKIDFDPSYDNPDFVLDNLTKGPIFLAYRADVCTACDSMEPVLKDIFNVEFGKFELFYKTIDYRGHDIVFYHINKDPQDPPYDEEANSFFTYDKDNRDAVPMFVMITLGNNSGLVQPYYSTAYGTLQLDNNKDREDYFDKMIMKGIELYNANIDDYREAVD